MCIRDRDGTTLDRLGREEGGLATGTGAEVEPLLPRADRPRSAQNESGEGRALVLNARPALPHCGQLERVTTVEHGADR